ncbi:MAG: hypothetical protein JOY69_05470 [Candidatus Eremiobacteraeota bacterium]|nr:hypothetical protein [Candidatus Eremiobacteraeota bacterium]
MWGNRVVRGFALGAAAAIVAGCSSVAGPSVPRGGSGLLATRAGERSGAPSKHLYVIEFDATKAVLEYPIEAGIPSAKTDRTITGLTGPNALAFDSAGHLFVLDGRTIKEFVVHANGPAKPIREIDVPLSNNIGALAVDGNGYVYVGQKQRIFVYAPGARGNAKPVAIFTPAGYPSSLTIDASNDLYALGNTQRMKPTLTFKMHVAVYTTPTKPTRVRGFCSRWLPNHGIDYGVQLDGLGNLFTTHPFFINSSPHGQIDVYGADDGVCPSDPVATIASTNPVMLGPVYLAVNSPYLYVYDLDYGNGGVVFTLKTSGSLQMPLSILYVADKRPHNAQGIAVGP